MRAFKRITIVAVGLWLCAALIASLFPWPALSEGKPYILDFPQRLAQLKADPASRRILLVGSSPVVMGLSAHDIQADTGIKTRNMGVLAVAPFFNDYAQEIFGEIRRGDIVVVANFKTLRYHYSSLPMKCAESFDVSCFSMQNMQFHPVPSLYLIKHSLFGRSFKKLAQDEYGDFDFSKNVEGFSSRPIPEHFEGNFSGRAAKETDNLIREIQERGACPVITFQPVLIKENDRAEWEAAYNQLFEQLDKLGDGAYVMKQFPVTSDKALFVYGEGHSSAAGRHIWTENLLKTLHSGGLDRCATL